MRDILYHKNKIISTLAYFGVFGWPLTPLEIQASLVRTSRPPALSELVGDLEHLLAMGIIAREHGLYALAGMANGFAQRRIEQEKIWAQKWRKMLRKAWWLQAVPYVRGMYASGSLAMGNTSADSDWDVFVIAQAGHLYTARLGLLIVAKLLRALRTKHDVVASDKFCFNQYVTTDGLAIGHRSLYTAQALAVLVPIYDPQKYLLRLWQANQWIGGYLPMPREAEYVRRSVQLSRVLGGIRRIGEFALTWLEAPLRRWQQARIMREPATHQKGGRVVATGRALEFHPRSFEAVALTRYNATIERHGLGAYTERDSGLTK